MAGAGLVGLLVVLVVSLVGRHWYAASDQAIELLHIRDVGTSRTPVVGAYSRLGWAHPGPLLFWLLAPFRALFGDTGVLVGSAVLNVSSLGAALWIARRHGGNRLLVLLWLGEIALVHGLGVDLLVDPWNPYLPVLPFLVFLLALWAVTLGDPPMIPVAVFTGSFAVQAHVGYAPLVLGLASLAVVATAVRRYRSRSSTERSPPTGTGDDPAVDVAAPRRRWSPTWGWAGVALGVVLWAPPVLQQLFGDPGNLSAIVDSLRDPIEPAAGLPYALGAWATQLGPSPPWLVSGELDALGYVRTSRLWPATAFLLVSIALGVAVQVRRGARAAATLTGGAVAATVIGVIATARVTGGVAPYLVRWWWPVSLVAYVAAAWCAVELVAPLVNRAIRRFTLRAALAVGLAATVAVAVTGAPVVEPTATYSTAVAHLVGPTARALDRRHRYFLVSVDSVSLGATGIGLFVALDGRGYHVFVDKVLSDAVGDERTLGTGRADATLYVVAGENRATWAEPPGARLVASFDPVTPAARREERVLQARFRRLLGDDAPPGPVIVAAPLTRYLLERHGARSADIERLSDIQDAGDSYRVYLVPARPPPERRAGP